MMRLVLWCMVWAASGASLWAETKPKVYNNVRKGEVESVVEKAIVARFSEKYEIVTFEESAAYVKPTVMGGSLPDTARTPSGEILSGAVMVGYVVTLEGRAVDAFVVETTDERLNPIALAATEGWRFQPAKLDGIPIPTMAGQSFVFKGNAAGGGGVPYEVVLYQSNDVMASRVPSVQGLADYIKRLQDVAEEAVAENVARSDVTIVIAVRPEQKSRVWLIPVSLNEGDPTLARFRELLEKVTPLTVSGGSIVFALRPPSARNESGDGDHKMFRLPLPREWKDSLNISTKAPVMIETYLDAAWPVK